MSCSSTMNPSLSVEDFPDEFRLRKRLERGTGDASPHPSTPPPPSLEHLDWYIPDADPAISRPQTVQDEMQRLLTLKSYCVVRALEKQQREYSLDRIATLAKHVFDVSMSFISIIDLGRCLFLAKQGIDLQQVPRRNTFCSHALLSNQDFYQITDPQTHPIFGNFPMVKAGLVQFYAAYPLTCPETGDRLGLLTLVDNKPRLPLTEIQISILQMLAEQAMQDLQRHRDVIHAKQKQKQMAGKVATLAHDLVTPLAGLQLSLSLLQTVMQDDGDDEKKQELVNTSLSCTQRMQEVCHDLRQQSSSSLESSPHKSVTTANTANNKRLKRTKFFNDEIVRQKAQLETNHDDLSSLETTLSASCKNKTALVIEDATVVRKIMAKSLQRLGWNVHTAPNGKVGFEMLTSCHAYDVCFLDFLMPVMDGFDCCRLYRKWEQEQISLSSGHQSKQQHQNRLRIIGMSAHASKKDVQRGLALGMDEFVAKPVTVTELQTLLLPQGIWARNGSSSIRTPRSSTSLRKHTKDEWEEEEAVLRSCLMIGSTDTTATTTSSVSASTRHIQEIIERMPGWTVTLANSTAQGGELLRARHWDVVWIDPTIFEAPTTESTTTCATAFVQDFREWESQHRIHLQKHIMLYAETFPTIIPTKNERVSETTAAWKLLPSGVNGTLTCPINDHDVIATLEASTQTRLGEQLITRL